jgi:serine protease inhibitor
MTVIGSQNETKNELIKGLKIDKSLGKDSENLDIFYQIIHNNLINAYNFASNDETNNFLISANKLIVNNIKINDSYQKMVEKIFNTKIDSVNDDSFKTLIDNTNQYIARLTNNKIKNLLDESFQTSSLVLINVIYFNFDWHHKFTESNTESNYDFYLNPSRTHISKVDMMNLNRKRLSYSYLSLIDSHLIKLPYQNKKYYFNIIMPVDENDFLDKDDESSIINNRLSYSYLKKFLFEDENIQLVNLKMPKFVIKSKIEV